MKHLSIALILILAFFTQTSLAQSWETMNPKPTAASFNNSYFMNDSTGCMVTSEGEIFRTANSGSTFECVFNDEDYTLKGIDFINESKGFVIGQSNFIGKTTDGGLTWTKMSDPGGYTYFDVNFVDDMHGWICGWYNTIIRTTNGGDTWQKLSGNVWSYNLFTTCDFINQDTGFFGGMLDGYPSVAILYKTYDGGITLQPIELPALAEEISDIQMISETEIWLCESRQVQGNSRLYHSTDAGATWQIVNIGYLTSTGQKIIFHDTMNGMVIGSSCCFTTNDGGQTWIRHYYYPDGSGSIRSGDWVNENTCYIAGQGGSIGKTTNGGTTWEELSTGSRVALSDIAFANNQTGCAVGSAPGYDYIYHTDDGGETWASVLDSITTYSWIYDITYTSETEAWACGSQDNVYHSTDGGSSWAKLHPTGDPQNSFFSFCKVTDGRIYFGGNKLVYSDNSGQTWQENDFESAGYIIRKVIFTDPMHGYLMCWETGTAFWGKMFRTRDGGLTWEEINYNVPGVLTKIVAADFLNQDTGIISIYGSGLARTTDGGDTWTYQGYNADMEVYYLKMFNDNEVVAANISEHVFYSWDGGISWDQAELNDAPQSKPISNGKNIQKSTENILAPGWVDGLYGTFFSEMGSGWLCWDGGLIKKYTDLYVGLDEQIAKPTDAYRIYPNPASTLIQIIGEKEPEFVSLFNSQGKCIQQYKGPISKISVSHLPAGVYLNAAYE